MIGRVLLLTGVVAMTIAPLPAATAADDDFRRAFGEQFFDRYWQLNPDWALAIGYYKYADRLDRARRCGRDATALEQIERWLAELARIDPATLSPAVRADWAMLENQLRARALVADRAARVAMEPVDLQRRGAVRAAARPRLRAARRAAARVSARASRTCPPTTPPQRRTSRRRRASTRSSRSSRIAARSRCSARSSQTPSRPPACRRAERATFAERLAAARAAIERLRRAGSKRSRHGSRAVPSRARSFRLGRELYAQKFAFDIQSGDTAEALYARAVAEKDALLARMTVLADSLWPKYFPNAAPPADDARQDRPRHRADRRAITCRASELVARSQSGRFPSSSAGCASTSCVELDPEQAADVRETPPHKRGIAGAGIDAPGPYDAGAPTYYNVTPLDDLPRGARRELAARVQPLDAADPEHPRGDPRPLRAARLREPSPSLIKSIFGNGAMIEGLGRLRRAHDARVGLRRAPAPRRGSSTRSGTCAASATRSSTTRVHVLGMTEAEAMDLLTRQAFQTEAGSARQVAARVADERAAHELLFAGYSAILDLREQLKREHGDAFDLKRFHEQFLSYGSAPVQRDSRADDRPLTRGAASLGQRSSRAAHLGRNILHLRQTVAHRQHRLLVMHV